MSFTLHRGLAVLALLACSLPAAAQQPCFDPISAGVNVMTEVSLNLRVESQGGHRL